MKRELITPEQARRWLEERLVIDFKATPRPLDEEKVKAYVREFQGK
jgi:hypothetical protein